MATNSGTTTPPSPSPTTCDTTPPISQSDSQLFSHTSTNDTGPPSDIAQDKSQSPKQPAGMTFPNRFYGNSKRCFQAKWYTDYPWVEYSVERDAVFCFPCRYFGVSADKALTYVGFRDWKHARGKNGTLTIHDSACSKHHDAVLSWKAYQSTVSNTSSVAVHLDRGRTRIIEENRAYVKAILECILYCCQQGSPLRGHRKTIDTEDSSINTGNFRSLVVLQSRSNDILRKRLTSGPKNASWLGHDMQNSLIALLADAVRKMMHTKISGARYFTLIADETKNISKSEQLSVVLRYIHNCKTYERFISYTKCEKLDAEALFKYIMTTLRELDVDINNCISQCYDGASVMSGCQTGVRARISAINPSAIYIHCHAHQVNLVLVDACRKLSHASEFFSLLENLYVFISSSVPHSLFVTKQKELGQRVVELKQLSETRWSCRYSSIKSVLSSFSALVQTLEELSGGTNHRSIESRGLLHQVCSFSFLLSLVLFEKVFVIVNNLSTLLQAEQLCYGNVASCIKATKVALSNLRRDDVWMIVWDKATSLARDNEISVTAFRPHRTRRIPKHLENSILDSTIVTSSDTHVEEYRTQVYYSTIDVILEEMEGRFSELNLSLLTALEALVPTSDLFLDLPTSSPFLTHYNISHTAVQSEAPVVTAFLRERESTASAQTGRSRSSSASNPLISSDISSLHVAYTELSKVSECFPAILCSYQIALTMGVSSAFSSKDKDVSKINNDTGSSFQFGTAIHRKGFVLTVMEQDR